MNTPGRHPKSTVIREWLQSDPILRSLPEASAYSEYASGMDEALEKAVAAGVESQKPMVLRHRVNRGMFVYISPAGGVFILTPFDRYGFNEPIGQYQSLSRAIHEAVQLDYWHLSDASLERLSRHSDWVIGTERKRLTKQYLSKEISLLELTQQMQVLLSHNQSSTSGESSCLPNTEH